MPKAMSTGSSCSTRSAGPGSRASSSTADTAAQHIAVVPKLPPEIVGILPGRPLPGHHLRSAQRRPVRVQRCPFHPRRPRRRCACAARSRGRRPDDHHRIVGGRPDRDPVRAKYPQRTLALCLPNTGPNLMNPARPRSKAFNELVALARSEGDRAASSRARRRCGRRRCSGGRAHHPAAVQRTSPPSPRR